MQKVSKQLAMSVLGMIKQSFKHIDVENFKILYNTYIRPYLEYSQSALEFCPIHCPNGRLGQDLGFGGFAFALKFPELLNTNLAAVSAKLGQTSCFPNGAQIWCPIGQ